MIFCVHFVRATSTSPQPPAEKSGADHLDRLLRPRQRRGGNAHHRIHCAGGGVRSVAAE